MNIKQLGPFLGARTAIDPPGDHYSGDNRNVELEDGNIALRKGFRNVRQAQSDFSSEHGLLYVQGFDSDNETVEEYISFERLSTDDTGECEPYSGLATDGYKTKITNVGAALGLFAGDRKWQGFGFKDKAFCFNQSDANVLYQHTLGDSESFTPLVAPDAPSSQMTYSIRYQETAQSAYRRLSWAGTDPGDVTVTGACRTANPSVDGTNQFIIQHEDHDTAGAFGSFEIDLNAITAGVQDWTYNDTYAFSMAPMNPSVFDIDPATVKVKFTNNAGTPITVVPSEVKVLTTGPSTYAVRVQFDNKTRSDWATIRKFYVEYNTVRASSTQANNKMVIGQPFIGCCMIAPLGGTELSFPYSFVGPPETGSMESGFSTPGSGVTIPAVILNGFAPFLGMRGLGTWILFAHGNSSDADKVRLYVTNPLETPQKFRRIVEQSDDLLTYTLKMSWDEILKLDIYEQKTFEPQRIVGAFPFNSGVVWLMKGGFKNVVFSRVGDPLSGPSLLDPDDDYNRGVSFTLSANMADEGITGFQLGKCALIHGSQGQYGTVVPDRPYSADQPRKLPGSFGLCNPFASCRWRDDDGNPFSVAMAKNGEGIYGYVVNENFDGKQGFAVIELSASVRPSISNFLLAQDEQGYTATLDDVRIGVDEARDALFVIAGRRAMVLRRPSLLDGKRQWEFYEWESPVIGSIAFSVLRRMRWLTSTGILAENEWNSVTESYIEGFGRDAGTPITGYWESGEDSGPNRRIMYVYVDSAGIPEVHITSDRQSAIKGKKQGKKHVRFGPKQQGFNHKYKIRIEEGQLPIRDMWVHSTKAGKGYQR